MKKNLDTRPLPQIWEGLTPGLKQELRHKLQATTQSSRVTVWRWLEKGSYPAHSTKEVISKTLGSVLGIKTTTQTLFP